MKISTKVLLDIRIVSDFIQFMIIDIRSKMATKIQNGGNI